MSETTGIWDATTERLLDFGCRADYESLPADVVHQAKRRLIDTFASARGAYQEPLAQMSRKVASRSRGEPEASVWGSTIRTTPEAAAFANGVEAYAAWTWVHATYRDSFTSGMPPQRIASGNRLPGVPRSVLYADIVWRDAASGRTWRSKRSYDFRPGKRYVVYIAKDGPHIRLEG